MTTTTTQMAGFVRDLPEAEYHAHPALSSTGAKALLKSPALFKYQQDHPKHSDAFDLGAVVHGMVLGTGWPVVVVQVTAKDGTTSNAANYQTASAKAHRDEIRAAGQVPILHDDLLEARAMADAVLAVPVARALFESPTGESETSAFWTDPDTGVDCRARFDRIARTRSRVLLADLKTCQDANPTTFGTTAARYGYDLQAWWYRDGYVHVADDIDGPPPFLHVLVEKEPPYLVSVVELDADALHRGGRAALRARLAFRAHTDTDTWPGYPREIQTVSLPRWAYLNEE